jgi:hypothetical protein
MGISSTRHEQKVEARPPGAPVASVPGRRASLIGRGTVVLGVVALVSLGLFGWQRSHHDSTPGGQLSSPSSSLGEFFGPNVIPRSGGSFGLDHVTFHASAGTPFATYLTVDYPPSSASARAANADSEVSTGGAQLYLVLAGGPVDSAYLRYYVRFPTGFQFVKGGKLPGLYGGKVTSGQHIPDGTNGLSKRYMWRTAGAGEVYAYLPTSQVHGTSLGRGNWSWPTGDWACVEQHVELNNPHSADGKITVWLNGKQVLVQDNLTFRTTSSLKINGLFFSTFFGGGDSTWATPVDQHVDFAAFSISSNRIGC